MMASSAIKRVSQSAVDWARFAAVCPTVQGDVFRILKTKHDVFMNKVHQLPENLPKIDFDAYKKRLPDPAMADRFKKAYEALSIPFPKDKDNVLTAVEAENQELDKKVKTFIADLLKDIEKNKVFLNKLDTLPKLEEMTEEVYWYYFPETAFDAKRPTLWPHNEESQPYNPEFEYIK